MCQVMPVLIAVWYLHPAGRPVSAETSIRVPGQQTSRHVPHSFASGGEHRSRAFPSILAGSTAATTTHRIGNVFVWSLIDKGSGN
jgi:hypothetical protein